MSQEQLMGYGYVPDNDDNLQSKQGGQFGANFAVTKVTQFEYKENVAKEGDTPREAIELVIQVRDRENKVWFAPITKVFGKEGQELEPNHSDYATNFNASVLQQNAVVTHYLKALGVSEEAMKNNLSTPSTTFKEYAQKIINLLPTGFDKKPLDLFLEYQWKIGKKADGTLNDKTYPQIPKNMKGGYFIVPAQPGKFKEVRGEDGSLSYVNESGTIHPFRRDASFMEGNKGTQQFLNKPEASNDGFDAPAQGQPQSTTW